MSSPNPASHVTLSTRTFPRRVRTLLEGIFELVTGELDRGLIATLDGFEQQLFKLAEQARSQDIQLGCLEALGTVKRGRFDLTPRYIAALETGLASVRDVQEGETAVEGPDFGELKLVDDVDMDESTLLHEIVTRAETRASLPLFLLSQRFGVIAGKPAFDMNSLPIGPATLGRHLRNASHCLELNAEHRLLLFRQFDRHLMGDYTRLVEVVNNFLINQGVLPSLSYVPTRFRSSSQADAVVAKAPEPAAGAMRAPLTGQRGQAVSPAHVAAALATAAFTGWPGDAIRAPASASSSAPVTTAYDDEDIFTDLRDLLHSARNEPVPTAQHGRSRPGVASASDVQSVLGLLQRRPAGRIAQDGRTTPATISHLKQDLLAQLRQITGDHPPPELASEDTDTIDLVSMLFDEIMKDVRPDSPASKLINRMQVPLLRVALRDKQFFNQDEHPARQALDAVAETGAYWAGEDPADRELIGNVERMVERISQEFDGDIGVFNTMLADLSNQTQAVMRRAEVAERRHVEAARGKERLTIAQEHAGRIMDDVLHKHPLPKFTSALLNQAWSDVIALTALRHGEDSEEWKRQVDIANQIATYAAAAASGARGAIAADPQQTSDLGQHVEQSLMQVGYQADEAAAIGQRLTTGSDAADDPSSRTEIAMKLKARARLGEHVTARISAFQLPPLTEKETECLERIRQLPFGTWLEFVTNQQGDTVRRRLSWFSLATGHCLFINHRGQRVGDYTLETLARTMARDQVRIVEQKQETLLARAMHRVVDLLRGEATKTHPHAEPRR